MKPKLKRVGGKIQFGVFKSWIISECLLLPGEKKNNGHKKYGKRSWSRIFPNEPKATNQRSKKSQRTLHNKHQKHTHQTNIHGYIIAKLLKTKIKIAKVEREKHITYKEPRLKLQKTSYQQSRQAKRERSIYLSRIERKKTEHRIQFYV